MKPTYLEIGVREPASEVPPAGIETPLSTFDE